MRVKVTGGRVEMSSQIDGNNPCVLIRGPTWGDAEFYGKWLIAAAQAEAFWKQACKDLDFEKQVQRVCLAYIPDFGISASEIIMRLEECKTTLVLDLYSEGGDDFVMMVTMGFFVPANQSYRMAIPLDLTAAKVRKAVLKYAQTEDEEYMLHPEYLVTTMSFSEARAWQNRLQAVDQFCNSSNVLGHA
jgi:hypothetical protein